MAGAAKARPDARLSAPQREASAPDVRITQSLAVAPGIKRAAGDERGQAHRSYDTTLLSRR